MICIWIILYCNRGFSSLYNIKIMYLQSLCRGMEKEKYTRNVLTSQPTWERPVIPRRCESYPGPTRFATARSFVQQYLHLWLSILEDADHILKIKSLKNCFLSIRIQRHNRDFPSQLNWNSDVKMMLGRNQISGRKQFFHNQTKLTVNNLFPPPFAFSTWFTIFLFFFLCIAFFVIPCAGYSDYRIPDRYWKNTPDQTANQNARF